ncbi:MAG: hypothetical protein AABW73_00880 [Nanoarchaeota archaeon]
MANIKPNNYAQDLAKAKELRDRVFRTARSQDYVLELDPSRSISSKMEVYKTRRGDLPNSDVIDMSVEYGDRGYISRIVINCLSSDIEVFGRLAWYLQTEALAERWKYPNTVELVQPFTEEQFEKRRREKLLQTPEGRRIMSAYEDRQRENEGLERRKELAGQFPTNSMGFKKVLERPDYTAF